MFSVVLKSFSFLIIIIILLVNITSSHAATYQLGSDPQASNYGQYNITGTGAADAGQRISYLSAFVDGDQVVRDPACNNSTECSIDYLAINGYLAESIHGQHTVKLGAYEHNLGVWTYGEERSFFVDRTTVVSITSPSGTVTGPYNVEGTVTFAPTRNSTKGYIYAYMDGSGSSFATKTCYDQVCSFSFPTESPHGSHSVKVVGRTVSADAEAFQTVNFFSDRTPSVVITEPPSSIAPYFNLKGAATFTPSNNSIKGYIYGFLDGSSLGSVSCGTETCYYDKVAYPFPSAGDHTVSLRATSQGTEAQAQKAINVSEILVSNWPRSSGGIGVTGNLYEVAPYSCSDRPGNSELPGNSTFNAITGNVSHSQALFSSTQGPLAMRLDFFYNSLDEFNIPPGQGNRQTWKLPLGQGWSHTYDISLFKNPDNVMVLKGGGLTKRFYTPSGSTYISQQGDSSTLVKNANNTYTITHRSGLKYNFDVNGILTSIVDRFNNTVSVTNNSTAKTKTITNPSGRTLIFQYDSNYEKVTSITDPDGRVYNLTYDTAGLLTTLQYPAPVAGGARPTWQYLYYPTSRLMNYKTDPEGHIVKYSYDASHRVVSSIDPDGVIDTSGNEIPAGHTKYLTYNSGNTILTEKDGGIWTYALDASQGIINGKQNPLSSNIQYTYNAAGLIDSETRPVDATTQYVRHFTYDSNGNVTDIQGNPVVNGVAGAVDFHIGYTYDASNYDQITSITDYMTTPNTVTQYAYDTAGGYKRTIITDPSGNQTVIRYESFGSVKDITYANGQVVSYAYNAQKNLLSITDPSGVKTEFTNYDSKGNAQTVKIYDSNNVLKQTYTIGYDLLARVTTITQVGTPNLVTTFTYDKNGNLLSILDANQKFTTYQYNWRGQVTKTTNALNKDTNSEYGSCGACGGDHLTAVEDANGNRTEFAYNQAGSLTSETDPSNKTLSYEYYPNGLPWKKIDASTNNVLVTYTYDVQRKLTGKSFLNGTSESFSYYPNGLLYTATNQNIGYTFEYYPNGWLKKVTDSNGRVVSYDSYDGAGQRQQVTYLPGMPDQKVLAYGYTSGRLSSIQSAAGTFGFGYDTLGRRSTVTFPNGIQTTYGYQADTGWLNSIVHQGNSPVVTINYSTFDQVGNRTSRNLNGVSTSYGYDDIYELTAAMTGAQREDYTYDPVGNRLSGPLATDTPYTYGAGNKITASPWATYTHDDFWNRTSEGNWAYQWDNENQMVNATDGSTSVDFKYDPFGRRIEKQVTLSNGDNYTHSYVYDQEDIVLEYIDSTTGGVSQPQALIHYVHGPGIDEPLAIVREGLSYFYHADGLGSIISITDSTQNVMQSYEYDSFGRITPSTSFYNPYTFTSREFDPETGLYYYRARYYDAEAGRFINKDPIGFEGGVNLFNYVEGNPVNWGDPFGLWTFQFAAGGSAGYGKGIFAIAGFVISYSKENGLEFGSFQTQGFGGYGGVSATFSFLDITFSKNNSICDLKGSAGTIQTSIGHPLSPFSLTGEANIMPGVKPSYSLSLNFGKGKTWIEEHGFYSYTWIQKWWELKW